MKKKFIIPFCLVTLFALCISKEAAAGGGGLPPSGTTLSCGNTVTFDLTNTGFVGATPTTGDTGCNPCCYNGADVDGDGIQDVGFSIENSQWFQFCNTSGASMTIDLLVDEPGGGSGCNVQGAIWTGASMSTTTFDCGNPGYQSEDSNPGGSADGFLFSNVVVPSGQCVFIMVDGYSGATCTGVEITIICPCIPPTVAVSGSVNPICAGSPTVLTSSCSANCTGIAYTWSPTTGLSPTSGSPVTASPTTTTTYTVTGTTPGGCGGTASITVTVNPLAIANAGPDQTLCISTPATLAGSVSGGASSGTWSSSGGGSFSPNASTLNATFTPPLSGTYTLTLTSNDPAGPCNAVTDQVVLTFNPLATVNAGVNLSLCPGNSITLNGSFGGSASGATWSAPSGSFSPNANTMNASYSPTITSGSINITLTTNDPSGPCPAATDIMVVTVNPAPNTNAGPDMQLTCIASTVILSGSSSSSPVSFSWSGPPGGINSGSGTANPVVDVAGNYTVTITNTSTLCTATDVATVTTNTTPPNANAGTPQTLTCTATSVVLNGSSSTVGATFSWAGPGIVSGGSTATPTVNAIGTYTITVTNPSNGCTATNTVVVSQNITPPNANAGSAQTLTCTATSVLLNGSSSTGGATFSWSGPGIVSGGATSTPTVNAVGTYTITVTNPANGCTATNTVAVSQNITPPNVNAGSDQTLTCAVASVNLAGSSSTGGATFSWSGPSIVSGGNTTTPTVNGTGNYTLTVTNPVNGCTSTDVATVIPDVNIPNVNAGPDGTLTCTTLQTILNGSSSTPTTTFSWAGPGIVSGGTTTSPTVNAPGNYTLTVTNTLNGCTAVDQATVILNNTPPNANAGTTQSLTCVSSTVMLNGSSSTGGATFNWSGPGTITNGTTATPTVNALGTFTVTVTNPINNCTNTSTVLVNMNNTPPNANAGSSQSLTCATTSLTLNGSSITPGATFNWNGPGAITNGNTATPTVNAVGTFTVTVTNPSNGCTNTSTVSVSLNNTPPNANAGSPQVLTCVISSANLSGSSSTPGATFSWSGPGTILNGNTSSPTVGSVGTFTLTTTDPLNGCTNTSTVNVSLNNTPPTADAGFVQFLTCTVTQVILNGNAVPIGSTFSWSGPGIVSGGSTANPTVNLSATYQVVVTDPSNGCTSTDFVDVLINDTLPNVDAGFDGFITCAIDTIQLNGSSNTSGVSYNWNGPGIVTGSNTATPEVDATGNYTVTVTNPINGCTSTDVATVTNDFNVPIATAGLDQMLTCAANTIFIVGATSTSNTIYYWTGPGIVSGGSTLTPVINTAGSYIFTVIDTLNGCSTTDTMTVISNITTPNVDAGSPFQLDCTNTIATLNGSSSSSAVNYQWSGTGIIAGMFTATATADQPGVFYLTVTDTINNCSGTDTVTVTQDITTPLINAGNDTIIDCLNSAIQLIATGGSVTYNWTGPGIVSGGSTNNPSVNQSGTYIVTVTSTTNGCTNTDTVLVSSSNTFSLSISNQVDVTCFGGNDASATVVPTGGTSPFAYTWSPSGGSDSTASNLTAGNYIVTTTDDNNCTDTITLTITEPSILILNLVDTITPECGTNLGSILVNSTGGSPGYNYSWADTSITGSTLSNIPSGSYIGIVIDNNNCIDSLNINLECYVNLVIPQMISPNGDGENDIWYVQGLDTYPNNITTIFNRWGNIVFKANPYNNDWSGTSNSNLSWGNGVLPTGTYFYIIDLYGDNTKLVSNYIEIQK